VTVRSGASARARSRLRARRAGDPSASAALDPLTNSENRGGEVLRVTGVSRSFAGVDALRDVTLELHRHEVLGLIGPNGAGKTTLVNVLSGFDFPSRGNVELDGREITSWSPHRRGRNGLARTFQHSRSFAELSVRENVEVAALGSGVRPRAARERAARLLELLGLEEHVAQPAGSLAHGDERKLGVARALASEPRYLLLDEPAAGLPEAEVPEFAAVVRSVRDEHEAGVLLIDHNMALVMDVCDRIQVLDQGRTLAEGAPAEIRANLDVAAAYLGEAPVTEA
jgi:branched-chain amino acid transport system ATP-binding protein